MAKRTLPTRIGRRPRLTIQGPSECSSHGGLPYTPRSGEEEGVMDTFEPNRIR